MNAGDPANTTERTSRVSRERFLRFLDSIRSTFAAVPLKTNHTEGFATAEFDSFLLKFENQLSKYSSVPIVFRDEDGDWSFDSRLNKSPRAEEAMAVHGILQLAYGGKLSRLMLCVCDKWFIGNRENQKSCSAACRHKVYERTDDFRDSRRVYMRKYYALRKSGKVK
jgi:hypothetical protein